MNAGEQVAGLGPNDLRGNSRSARVLVCRVGQAPVVEAIHQTNASYLDALQSIVGGYVTAVALEDGVDLWCNDDAHALGLELNRVIPTVAPPVPAGFEDAFRIEMGDDLAEPGELAEWRIYGDCLIARSEDGELQSLTDEDIARYTGMCPPAAQGEAAL